MALSDEIIKEVKRYNDGNGCTRRQLADNILVLVSQGHRVLTLDAGRNATTGNNNEPGGQEMVFEYCPSCAGDLDTGYECGKCGRDWQSYVHDATLRIETETEQ